MTHRSLFRTIATDTADLVGACVLLVLFAALAVIFQPEAGSQTFQDVRINGQTVTKPLNPLYQTKIYGAMPTQLLSVSPNGTVVGVPLLVPSMAQPVPASTTLLQALNNARNVPVHILVTGDSFTISDHFLGGGGGGPLVPSNRWAEQVRTTLQSIYGSHGTGIFPLTFSMNSTPQINLHAWSCTGSFDTSTSALGPSQSSGNTLVHLAAGSACTFNDDRSIPFTSFSLYYATPASGCSLRMVADRVQTIGLATNTNAAETGASNQGLTSYRFDSTSTMTSSSHSIAITNTGSGDCYLYGADGVNGSTGVSIDLAGVGGSNTNAFGSSPANQLAFFALIPGGPQAVWEQHLTNDVAYNLGSSTFQSNEQNIITFFQGLPSAPSVSLIISPVDIVNNTISMAPYTAALAGLCATDALTCVNIQSRGTTVGSTSVGWGTTYNAASGLFDVSGTTNSGVHPNDKGNLDEAQLIYSQLVSPSSAGSGTTADSYTATNGSGNNFIAQCTGVCSAGYNFSVPGLSSYDFVGFSTGSGAGLSGVVGLYNRAASHFAFNFNSNDDFCGITPVTAVSSCIGSTWIINHLGMFEETPFTPASSSATCTPGQFTDDANYHYVCVATNTWKRSALTAF